MKKTFLKITFSVLSMLGLASCLGDTTSYVSGDGYAYITTSETTYQPVLVVLSGYAYPITTPVLEQNGLSVGDCAFVNFKIYPENVSGNTYYTEEVTVLKKYFKADHLNIQMTTAPVVSETDTLNVFETLSRLSSSSNEIIGDKWFLKYTTKLQKDQKEEISLYYDAQNQPDIAKKVVYIDFRVKKLDPKDGVRYDSSEKTIVVNFRSLRNELLLDAEAKTSYSVYFRYYGIDGKDKTKAVELILNSGSGLYKEEE